MLMQSLRTIKLYNIINSGIIAVVSYKGIILSKMGNFLSTAQKHNRYSFKCNRPGPTHNTHTTHTHTEPIKAHITNKKVHKLKQMGTQIHTHYKCKAHSYT